VVVVLQPHHKEALLTELLVLVEQPLVLNRLQAQTQQQTQDLVQVVHRGQ
jgi:hypothetical protein